MLRTRTRPLAIAAAAGLACAAAVLAQPAPEPTQQVAFSLDSGPMNMGFDPQPGREAVLSWVEEVRVAGAPWVRVHFGPDTLLAGTDRHKGGSYLVITSKADGAKHYLDAAALPQWDFLSAYMNGDTVRVELYAVPGMGVNRVTIDRAIGGAVSTTSPPRTICGGTDDRVPYNEPRAGRIGAGCTGWMTSFNGAANEFLTAGHCLGAGQVGAVVMFNVPPSTNTGGALNPPPEFQYPIQSASIQRFDGAASGDDGCRYNTNNNSNTGMSARVAQGQGAYLLASAAPASGTAATTVRGYGVVNDQAGIPVVPEQWNVLGKTHTAAYSGKTGTRIDYLTDTDGGNSGSPVTQIIGFLEQAIGIHTDGFCPGNPNSGTAIEHPTLQGFLASPTGVALPFDGAAYNTINTTFASDNGGADGGSIFFNVTTGIHSLEVTHFNLNILRNSNTNNATASEDDDFFNFQVYVRPGTASGFQTSPLFWTKVADGAGMPKPQDTVTLGALKNTFTLAGNQSYGMAIVFDSGAAHAYTNGTGSNETYSNADLSITGISAANTAFGALIDSRVFNGGFGYHVNTTTGQCLETDFAQDNGGSNGGMVYFNVAVGSSPINLTALSTNVEGAGGLNCNLTLYRKNGTFSGFENNPGAWTQVATASGTSSAVDVPSQFALSNFVALNASTTYGFALRLSTSGTTEGHAYTNGTGLNQTYQDDAITITTGSATNLPFSGSVLTPRVWNGALCYGKNLSVCSSNVADQFPPNPEIGGFTSATGGQEEADNFGLLTASTISGASFWAAYGNTSPPASQDFIVRFFSNVGGLPGTLLATRTINNVSLSNTGMFMEGGINKPIYQFNLTFPQVYLPAGTYWVSALGNDPAFNWIWARTTTTANAHAVRNGAGAWAASTGDFALALCGGDCYANCDGSTTNPILNVADFTCFLNRYAAGQAYANCDGSTQPPILNVADFTCFLNKYAAGCP
jgi:V8-like Glu-specific endopeptidase